MLQVWESFVKSFIFLRRKPLMKKENSLCLCLKTKIHQIHKKGEIPIKRFDTLSTNVWEEEGGGRLWWALSTSLTSSNFFQDCRCRNVAFIEIDARATLLQQDLISRQCWLTEPQWKSASAGSRHKKKLNIKSWNVSSAFGRWMAPCCLVSQPIKSLDGA